MKPNTNKRKHPLTIENLKKSHPFRQWRTWTIPNTSLQLTGYSRSGDKTFYYIPQIKLCLDAALAEGRKGNYVLLTHTHFDHSADIEYLSSNDGVHIYLPQASKSYLENHIKAARSLNHSADYDPYLRRNMAIHGVVADDVFFLENGRYQVRVVACRHSIPCVGYAISALKNRLKPEYEALKIKMKAEGKMNEFGKLMAEKRKEENIQEKYWEPIFVFMGDTQATVFEDNEWLFDYPVILTECTFMVDGDEERAVNRGHTHWKALKPHILAHPDTLFMLTHFTFRQTESEIITFFEEELNKEGEEINNVSLWLSGNTLLPQQHQSSKK